MITFIYGSVLCLIIVHAFWFSRIYISFMRQPLNTEKVATDLREHLVSLNRFAQKNMIAALLMLLAIALLNALVAWNSLRLLFSAITMKILFGIGNARAGFMTLGISGLYCGAVYIASLFMQIRARSQLSILRIMEQQTSNTAKMDQTKQQALIRRRNMALLMIVSVLGIFLALWLVLW